MKILLLGNYEPLRQESMERFVALLNRDLAALDQTTTVWKPVTVFGKFKYGPLTLRKWMYYVDQFIVTPPMVWWQSRSYDLVHICDHSNAMYGRWIADGIPWIVTCHDAIAIRAARGEFAQRAVSWSGRILQTWIRKSLGQADYVACDSQATLDDLQRLNAVDPSRLLLIELAPNRRFTRASSAAAATELRPLGVDLTSPFFLHVGGNQWYKNRAWAVRVFSRIRRNSMYAKHHLVLAGKPPDKELNRIIDEVGSREAISILESVSDRELDSLYSIAVALLFPSIAEGFGWPILEAQLCGCPVFTSAKPPMSQISGFGSVLLNLNDAEEDAQLVIAGLTRSKELISLGYANASRFDPKAVAQKYMRLYVKTLA